MTTYINPVALEQFSGTDTWYRHGLLPSFLYTEGVKYLADNAQAHWLIDLIASHQIDPKVNREPFQVWTLEQLNADSHESVAYMQPDSNEPRIVEQKLGYTDFPFDSLGNPFRHLLVCDNVLMLKSEY